MILVGGLGTRLRPLTYELPKPLFPIGGRPALRHLLDSFSPLKPQRIILACRYGVEQFRQFSRDFEAETGQTMEVVEESCERGTGGALTALELGDTERVWVVNGDTLTDLDTAAMSNLHQAKAWGATMAVTPVSHQERYGSVHIEEELLRKFIEKDRVEKGPGWINAGVYLFEAGLLKMLPLVLPLSLEREVFPQWLSQGLKFGVYRHRGQFLDIGVPESYLQSQVLFLHDSFIHPTAFVHPTARVEGKLFVGAECKIEAGVRLVGPTTLGRAVHLGHDSIVEGSVLWDEVQVGVRCHLQRCILGSQVGVTSRTHLSRMAVVSKTPLDPEAGPLEVQF